MFYLFIYYKKRDIFIINTHSHGRKQRRSKGKTNQ